MLTVAIPKRNKLQNIIVLTPKDGPGACDQKAKEHSFQSGCMGLGKLI